VSFLIAFAAGVLGILSPCILPFLPAYFSYTFKEKKNITLMTLVFFTGFALVFVSMGIVAGLIGEQTLIVLQQRWLVTIAGGVIFLMGGLTFLGKGFGSLIHFDHKFENDVLGVFLMGVAFALGWTACLGPILAGILSMGAILGKVWLAGLLMFFYALGNLVPLFLLSFFYDRFKLSESKLIKGKVIVFNLFGKLREVHSTNLISGLLFMLMGLILVIFGGTGVFNNEDFLGTKSFFYSLQNLLLGWKYANLAGGVALIVFVAGVGYVVWKEIKKKEYKS
jgi:cytochrome c-type biogenesis protein